MPTGKIIRFIPLIVLIVAGMLIEQGSGSVTAQTPTEPAGDAPTEVPVLAFVIQSTTSQLKLGVCSFGGLSRRLKEKASKDGSLYYLPPSAV